MAAPTPTARTTSTLSAGNNFTVALGSPSAGDLLVAFVAVNTVNSLQINRALSGDKWRLESVLANSTVQLLVAWKVAEGSDVLRFIADKTGPRVGAVCYKFASGAHGSTVTVATASSGNSTNGDPPSCALTTTQDALFIAGLATISSVASAAPTGYSSLTTAGGTAGFISTAEKAVTSATSDDPATFTNTSQRWVACTVAVGASGTTTQARSSQVAAEVLNTNTGANMVATQSVVEVLSANALTMLASQVVVEMISTNVADDSTATAQAGGFMGILG